MGYGDNGVPEGDVSEIIESLLAEASQICHPRLGFRVLKGELYGKNLRLAGLDFIPDAIIAHKFKGCPLFAIIIGSVGSEMDSWLESYRMGDDIMKAFVSDAIGSTIAETICSIGLEKLRNSMAEVGLKVTNSYSPGYCGWHVSEQKMLFSLLPESFCGITLTDSSLMLPIKSVSAVVGVAQNAEMRPYGCAICKKKDCFRRKS